MLSLIVISAACSALVAAAMTFWLISRRRTLQVQQLDIVDSEGRVRGRLSTFDGKVGLALGDGAGRTQVGMFVNKEGQPGITLFDDKETARFSLEIVEVPKEVELGREQLKTSTIRHRMTALATLYAELDGEDAYNPVKGVKRPKEPEAKPDSRPPTSSSAFSTNYGSVPR